MSKLSTNFLGMTLKNPIVTASGTYVTGDVHKSFYDITKLGAITSKGTMLDPWPGNPQPRMFETPSGVMNSIGLQGFGMEAFKYQDKELSALSESTPIILNIAGHSIEKYVAAVEKANELNFPQAYEINISCPNVDLGGACLGLEANTAKEVTKQVKAVAKKPIIMKLTPQAYSLVGVAQAVQDAGADAVSLVNTFSAMAINVHTRRSRLSKTTAGLSGPAIHPIALRMVYEVAQAVDIPILGMGGVYTWEDAAEFILAGACTVGVGTLNLTDPSKVLDLIDGLEAWVTDQGVDNISELVGGFIEP
ncbi:MAG: dihydroorotate dehydrogenase [Coriobacteriia bacterium]|nr:dihydroorotate dehydrogenase [Coriobacteriia bacterium]